MPVNEYTRIGWIGLGQMGNPMVTRLLDGNIEVGIYNRSPGKTDSLATKGAKVYGSTIELVRDYPVIFLMVSDYAAVRDILAGEMLTKLQPKTLPSKNLSNLPADNLPKPQFPVRSVRPPMVRCSFCSAATKLF